MKYKFYLDKCEDTKLVFVESLVKYYKNKPNIVIKKLDIGDVLFTIDDKPWLCIERKNVVDLISSLHDGRYREQKLRLKAYRSQYPGLHIMYIIEGFSMSSQNEVIQRPGMRKSFPKSTILSIITKLQFRDEFLCHVTQNIHETKWFLDKTFENLQKGEFCFANKQITENDYLKEIKTVKKANIVPNIFLKITLLQIPGISITKADAIFQIYKTIPQLLQKYKECTTAREKENLLAKIKVSQNRKLGPVASKKIFQFMHGIL